MPINNMVLEARVLAIDNLTDMIRQILNRIGTPLHTQSLEFIWKSGVQALWLLEAHLFPEQTPQTPTELVTPSGDAHSFRFLLHDATFQAHVSDLLPSWNSLLQFSDFLQQARDALNVPSDIIQAVWDASLILENIGLVFGIDFSAQLHRTMHPPMSVELWTTRRPLQVCLLLTPILPNPGRMTAQPMMAMWACGFSAQR